MAEDRALFKELLERIGEPAVESAIVHSVEEAHEFARQIPLPLVIRPAFTLGGTGGGVASTPEELDRTVTSGINASPIHQILLERSLTGWKEIEYEVMRDGADTCITICNMENFDPMGVHTGDSIVVAPSQTLSDREYQMLRSSALKIIRALGKRLDELTNAVTGKTTAAFEPALDYCVVKIPRWPFDKFGKADRTIGTQMKATGEVMAIDRSFEGALQKAVRSLETTGKDIAWEDPSWTNESIDALIARPNDLRLWTILAALRRGATAEQIHKQSRIDLWFLTKLAKLVAMESRLAASPLDGELLWVAKRAGFSDVQ